VMCLQSVDRVDEAQRLREVSEQLRDTAVNTATNIEDGMSPTPSSRRVPLTVAASIC